MRLAVTFLAGVTTGVLVLGHFVIVRLWGDEPSPGDSVCFQTSLTAREPVCFSRAGARRTCEEVVAALGE